jgi:HK97 gp10 family phage protein
VKERIEIRLTGDKELYRKLAKLNLKVEAVLEVAVQAAATVIQNAANPMAPGPNIEQDTVERKRGRVVVHVGPDKAHWHYRFAEFGTAAHGPKRRGRKMMVWQGGEGLIFARWVEGVPARPFLRPAADANSDQAEDAMGKVLRGAIMKETI